MVFPTDSVRRVNRWTCSTRPIRNGSARRQYASTRCRCRSTNRRRRKTIRRKRAWWLASVWCRRYVTAIPAKIGIRWVRSESSRHVQSSIRWPTGRIHAPRRICGPALHVETLHLMQLRGTLDETRQSNDRPTHMSCVSALRMLPVNLLRVGVDNTAVCIYEAVRMQRPGCRRSSSSLSSRKLHDWFTADKWVHFNLDDPRAVFMHAWRQAGWQAGQRAADSRNPTCVQAVILFRFSGTRHLVRISLDVRGRIQIGRAVTPAGQFSVRVLSIGRHATSIFVRSRSVDAHHARQFAIGSTVWIRYVTLRWPTSINIAGRNCYIVCIVFRSSFDQNSLI